MLYADLLSFCREPKGPTSQMANKVQRRPLPCLYLPPSQDPRAPAGRALALPVSLLARFLSSVSSCKVANYSLSSGQGHRFPVSVPGTGGGHGGQWQYRAQNCPLSEPPDVQGLTCRLGTKRGYRGGRKQGLKSETVTVGETFLDWVLRMQEGRSERDGKGGLVRAMSNALSGSLTLGKPQSLQQTPPMESSNRVPNTPIGGEWGH